MNLVLKIALGIILAFVVMGTIAAVIDFYAVQALNESLQKQALQAQERIKQQKEAELREQQRKSLIAQQKQERKRKAQLLTQKKYRAWSSWYKERERSDCNVWKSDSHMVECTNYKMRVKAEFNKLWDSQLNTASN